MPPCTLIIFMRRDKSLRLSVIYIKLAGDSRIAPTFYRFVNTATVIRRGISFKIIYFAFILLFIKYYVTIYYL